MRNLSILFVAGLGLLAVGCGGGGSSSADACEHGCGCVEDATEDPEFDFDECVSECEGNADESTAECRSCVADASCSAILGGTACQSECSEEDAFALTSQMEPEQLASLGY